MIEIIKGSFFAGEVKTFLIQGEYVEILEAAYPIDVSMMDRSGAQLSTMRNAEASYFSRPGKYEVIQVTSASAQTVRLFVGSGDAGTRRTSGEVSVIDGGKSRSLAGVAYFGSTVSDTLAANNSYVQLWNPVGSGKNLVVSQMIVAGSVGNVFAIGGDSAALTTLTTSAQSKKIGGAASASTVMRKGFNPGVRATFTEMFVVYVVAQQSQSVSFREPLIVPPGSGLTAYAATLNTDIRMSVEFLEEVI